jgi:hypothetical protein
MTNAWMKPAGGSRHEIVKDLRLALTTAESAARTLTRRPEIEVQAQALLHRLAAIRAEVDLLELTQRLGPDRNGRTSFRS